MATLTVKNVGPIREAEVEVKKHTIFIGPQGSGKSTLAKLIAIGSNMNMASIYMYKDLDPYTDYLLNEYITNSSYWRYENSLFYLTFDGKFDYELTNSGHAMSESLVQDYNRLNGTNAFSFSGFKKLLTGELPSSWSNARTYSMRCPPSNFRGQEHKALYIPTERMLVASLTNSVWGLVDSGNTLPKTITQFGVQVEHSRLMLPNFSIKFLSLNYQNDNGIDVLYDSQQKKFLLNRSASGYQAIIPLLHTVEANRDKSKTRFVIEEPELNLYPTTQKDLIYSLVSGLRTDTYYLDSEWVITTHSPYVLSSYNTLLLAHKVAQKSEELREEVAKIIPELCWINPDDFAAYFVDKGTVRSIINPKTGLIKDNELDDVSEILAGEQDQLLELNRSFARG